MSVLGYTALLAHNLTQNTAYNLSHALHNRTLSQPISHLSISDSSSHPATTTNAAKTTQFIAQLFTIGTILLVALAIVIFFILRSDSYDPPATATAPSLLPLYNQRHTTPFTTTRPPNTQLSRAVFLNIFRRLGESRGNGDNEEQPNRGRSRIRGRAGRQRVRDRLGRGKVGEREPLVRSYGKHVAGGYGYGTLTRVQVLKREDVEENADIETDGKW